MSSIFFTLDPTHIAGLKKIIKDKDEILRHLLVNKRDIEYHKKIERSESRKPSSKVDLKEIDKKIEEMLNE
jgi:ribosomal protein S6